MTRWYSSYHIISLHKWALFAAQQLSFFTIRYTDGFFPCKLLQYLTRSFSFQEKDSFLLLQQEKIYLPVNQKLFPYGEISFVFLLLYMGLFWTDMLFNGLVVLPMSVCCFYCEVISICHVYFTSQKSVSRMTVVLKRDTDSRNLCLFADCTTVVLLHTHFTHVL